MPFDATPGAMVGRLLSPSCSSGSYPQASAEEQKEISVSLLSAEIYNMIVQVDLGVRYGDSWKYRE